MDPEEGERSVGCLVLGGKDQDKIFVACGQTIKGITKKGKEFFKFGANLTEDVRSMAVINKDAKIFTGGDFLFNEFVDCKDSHYCLMPDKINDLTLGDCGLGAEGQGTYLSTQSSLFVPHT